ncbi:hybrid sensor histidine kinase/response regulator [Roseospira goensis]|uniref:histidine kinase n=1 Tax=Roseospira goensis TaxID=391922 RepID=A0A7W6RWF9_9PROT|nr:PAS domain S-box protein [Roseospira goensis]MBB4284480.1 PAS domain S-box-containing protein [Roseospira goensis]
MQGVRLDRLWDLTPQAVLLLDRDGRIVQANRAAALRLGEGDPDHLAGRDYFALLPAAVARARRDRLRAVLDPAETETAARSVVDRVADADGRPCLVRWTLVPVGLACPDTAAAAAPVVMVCEDEAVTPEAPAQERRSEGRFRNAFDQAPHGMALMDIEGRWRRVNPALVEMLGRPPEALIGRSVLSVTHPDDWAAETAWLDAALAGDDTPFDAEKRFLRPDGTLVWARVTGAVTRGPDGRPQDIVAQIADVSRHRTAEEALRASESRFRESFAAAPHGMAILALDGRFEEVNAALCRMLERTEADLLARDITAVSHPEDLNLELEAARRLLAGDVRVFSGEKRYLKADGAVVRAHVSLALARDGAGQPRHFIAHVQDITRQVDAEARLHEAIDAAEQALVAKTRFLAAASHDLRQPLQALNLFVSVLSGRETDPAKQDILGKVERSLAGLSELMNTLLDISKLEAGAILPDQRPFDARALLDRLADEFEPVALAGGHTLRLVPPAVTLYSDPALLEVILRNLIGNALKYTPHGGRVLVGGRRRDGGRSLRLDVIDTGPGIPPDQRRLVFEDFHQVPPDAGGGGAGHRGGLGLGLGIVSRVARLLGVAVTVDSTPGHGARFSVEVPCHEAGAATDRTGRKETPAPGTDPAGLTARADRRDPPHLVVVDDEAPVRESLTLLLEGWGHRVSAFAGLSDLTEALLTDRLADPDVLLVDFRLPSGRTGIEAVALTRGHFRRPIPALLLTGDTDSHRLREASRGGLPVLQKPVRPDQLRVKLADLIGATRRRPGTTAGPAGPVTPP